MVPLVTVKGQTKFALSSAYLVLGRDHSPSLCFTKPLTNSSVHIIKILHMKTLILFFFLHISWSICQFLSLKVKCTVVGVLHWQTRIWNFSSWRKTVELFNSVLEKYCTKVQFWDSNFHCVTPTHRRGKLFLIIHLHLIAEVTSCFAGYYYIQNLKSLFKLIIWHDQ